MTRNTNATIIILSCILTFIEGVLVSDIMGKLANHHPVSLPLILLTFGIGAFAIAGLWNVVDDPIGKPSRKGAQFIDTSWGDKLADISLRELTCYGCIDRSGCRLVDNPYNRYGDCLIMK